MFVNGKQVTAGSNRLLLFTLRDNISARVLQKWRFLKRKCESGDVKDVVTVLKTKCQLRHLSERGRGTPKQIRFVCRLQDIPVKEFEIALRLSETVPEIWSEEELEDLLQAFGKMTNTFLMGKRTTGDLY